MKSKLINASVLFISSILLNACATIFLGTSQKVYLNSNPQGADIYVNGVDKNMKTPNEIEIKKKNPATAFNKKNEMVYVFKKDGYENAEYHNLSKAHWLIYADFFYYIIPGVVDIVTKAHRVYDKNINVNLYPVEKSDTDPPKILITYPNIARGFKHIENNGQIIIRGKITDASNLSDVLINNNKVQCASNGEFAKPFSLDPGDNNFIVKATDIHKNSSIETFIVQRPTNLVENKEVIYSKQSLTNPGKFYALIIGNNIYLDKAIPSLDGPASDAAKLYKVLTTKYTFESQNITFLIDATYEQMIQAFDNLSNEVTQNDNLIVFYAGHGWWDEKKKLGYWLPSDAKKANTAFWIPNSRISDYMSSIKSKHTLLIADACFSGGIFKTRSAFSDASPAIIKLYQLASRKAMTSGNLKEVPDKSVFLQYLVKRLDENAEKYLSSDVLFASFRQAVLNNSPNAPQYGTIRNAGDEGGEFIFIRKQ